MHEARSKKNYTATLGEEKGEGGKGEREGGGGEREMAKRGLEGDFHVGSAKYYARVAALLTGTKI